VLRRQSSVLGGCSSSVVSLVAPPRSRWLLIVSLAARQSSGSSSSSVVSVAPPVSRLWLLLSVVSACCQPQLVVSLASRQHPCPPCPLAPRCVLPLLAGLLLCLVFLGVCVCLWLPHVFFLSLSRRVPVSSSWVCEFVVSTVSSDPVGELSREDG
jgi:hypothetical protein